MKTKAKKFSYKLLALFMALVMGITCFSGVMTSYAASKDIKYVDGDVEYNSIAWNVLSDEQLATSVLDFADEMLPVLANLEKQLSAMVDGMKISVLTINWDINKRQISLKALGSTWVTITVKLGSVDELMETLESVADALNGGIVNLVTRFGLDLGIIDDLDFSATKNLRRTKNTSCEIVRGVLGLIYNNIDIIDQVFRGTLSLGVLNDTVNVYKLVGGLFDAPDGYQSDFVYNIVRSIMFKYTKWFSEEEKANYINNPNSFVYDDVLLDKMTTELLTKINAEITYKAVTKDGTAANMDTVSSRTRYAMIKAKSASEGISFRAAASALGYDPDIVYTSDGNVYLFVYGTNEDGSIADSAKRISLKTSDSLFAFGYQALDLAWKTALKDTVNTVRVNYDVDRGHGSNFDNAYYYWAKANLKGGWDTNNLKAMYSKDNLKAWANAPVEVAVELVQNEDGSSVYVNKDSGVVYDDSIVSEKFNDAYESLGFFATTTVAGTYGAEDADEFLGWVENNFTFDRTIADDAKGTWADIDEETLFNKLRYSPLADYGFDIQTGPINLYFMQTGVKNLEAFFNGYSNYNSLVAGLNDCLLAAVKDIFVNSDNIYVKTKGDTSLTGLASTDPSVVNKAAKIGEEAKVAIVNTLVGNALKVVQYTADTTDRNILNGFYKKYGDTAKLSEANLEEAMIPMLVACIGQVNLSGDKLEDLIHPEDWNRAKDAEAVAFIALREFLSFALPQKDYDVLAQFTDDKITVSFDNIKIMARDALIYVLEPYVPVTDKKGNRWTADTDTVDMTTDIFDLLNSVLCYYADFYTDWQVSARRGEKGLGAAPLLGLYDNSTKKSLINKNNTIWENLDVAINKILPVVGELQGNGYANAKSEQLIMRDIVNGVLDIGTKVQGTNMYGVSNFLYRLLTIVSADPIQTTPIVTTVYNFLKDFINALFGPRYTPDQKWVPIPDAKTNHPFDDFFHVATLAGTGSNDVGAIHKLINNFIEFSGYGPKGIASYDDTLLPGLTFAVSAANSFFNFLPFIGEHQLKLATAEYDPSAITGAAANTGYKSNIVVTNNSTGINTAFLDGMNDYEVIQNDRYYIQVTDVKMLRSDGAETNVTGFSSARIAPGNSLSIPVTTTFINQTNNSCTYVATVTYNVYQGASGGYPIYTGVETNAYQYLSSAVSWYDTVYPSTREEGGIRRFPQALEPGAGSVAGSVPNRVRSTPAFGTNNNLYASYPENIVVSTTTLSQVNSMGLRIRNDGGSSRNVDGIYFFDNKSVVTNDTSKVVTSFTPVTTTVNVNKANAIPVFDKETGDLLAYDRYDISYNGKDWDRTGYDDNALQQKMEDAKKNNQTLHTRIHVAYTLQEAINNGIIAAYYVNSNDEYEYIYLKAGNLTYQTILSNVSMRGPVDGIRVTTLGTIPIDKNSTTYIAGFAYDGGANIAPGTYTANINFYTSNNNNGTAEMNFIIADDGNSSALSEQYSNLASTLANYRQSDFVDYNGSTSKVFSDAKDALLQALAVEGSVLNADTAPNFADKTVLTARTRITDSPNGDKAFVPFSTRLGNDSTLPTSVKNAAYVGGSLLNGEVLGGVTGVYYFDKNCTIPIYSDVPLTSANVRNGLDPADMPVNAVTENGKTTYYLANSKHMETEWDVLTYAPYAWLAPTDKQATDENGNLLYEQVQYVYRDSNGVKVNSTDDWACKFPETEYQIIKNDGKTADNRGLYTKAMDNIQYRTEQLLNHLDTSLADAFLTDVSELREGLIENNFDIITYNKMVNVGRAIEKSYNVVVTYISNDEVIADDGSVSVVPTTHTATVSYEAYKGYRDNKDLQITGVSVSSTLSSLQIEQFLSDFDFAMSNIIERGYIGDRLEAEIICAAQGAYDDFTVTTAKRDDNGNVTTNATVSSSAVSNPQFGAYVGGQLVNAGAVIYPSYLWNNYINALAEAVSLAQFGNSGDYMFAERDYYDSYSKDEYIAQVTTVYEVDCALQVAEIALENVKNITLEAAEGGTVTFDGVTYDKTVTVAVAENEYASITINPDAGKAVKGVMVNGEFVPVTKNEDGQYVYTFKADDTLTITPVFTSAGITISGKVVIATDLAGTNGTYGLGDIDIVVGGEMVNGKLVGGEVVGTTNSTGTKDTFGNFEVTVPAGTTEIIFAKTNVTYAKAVKLSGANDISNVIIPVVMGDYNNDGYINTADRLTFNNAMIEYFIYSDYNSDGIVNSADKMYFNNFLGTSYGYDVQSLD